MEPSTEELISAMNVAAEETPALKTKFNAVIEFRITDEDGDGSEKNVVVDLTKNSSINGKGKPDLIVSTRLQVFHLLLNKKLTPQQAFMQQKLKIKGKMGLAMKLNFLLNATRKQLQKQTTNNNNNNKLQSKL
jgi:putative sterol carrier protein